MSASTIGLLAVIAVLVATIALYLIWVSYALWRVSFILGTVLIGVRAIVEQVDPVPTYVSIILNDVMAIDVAAKQLLNWGKGSPEPGMSAALAPTRR